VTILTINKTTERYNMKTKVNSKATKLVKTALIGAMYAAFTYISAAFGLAYGVVQFRFSEILTILPIFCPEAAIGLTVGCIVSNIISSVSPLDMIFGSAATLLAAVLTRALRKITIKGYPILSFLSPVIINAVIVGAELCMFGTGEGVTLTLFSANALSVALGEAAVVFTLGTALFYAIGKNEKLSKMLG
jgi:uncharacterized membrane protein